MTRLYVFAEKNQDGSVEIRKPQEFGKPAIKWLTIDKFHSYKPDYRNRYINLNCYKYAIFWVK